jgi:hypothetical protein
MPAGREALGGSSVVLPRAACLGNTSVGKQFGEKEKSNILLSALNVYAASDA